MPVPASQGARLLLVTGDDDTAIAPVADVLRASVVGATVTITDPSELRGAVGQNGSVALVAVGGAGHAALAAADDAGGVAAVAIISAPLGADDVALIADWPELPLLALADSADRPALRSAVDAHLASTHGASRLIVRPVDQAALTEVAAWLSARVMATPRVDEVVVTSSDGWALHGTRWLPERSHPVPGVVLLHTGRSDRAVFARLERLLAGVGLAVLNLDWRGRGQSTNLGSYFDLPDHVRHDGWRDAVAAIAHLASRPEVDAERIGIVGSVHGAEHAARAAWRDRRVRALVLLTGYRPDEPEEERLLMSDGVAVLYVTSTDHTITTTAMRSLYEASRHRDTEYVEYPGGAIGYQLFETDPSLEPRIVAWLDRVLVGVHQ